MEHKTFPAFTTKVDATQGIVEAVVAVTGNVDLGDDVIRRGSFAKTLAERGNRAKVLDQHNSSSIMCVIGKPLEIREVGRDMLPAELLTEYPNADGGLYTKTQYLIETPEGAGAFARIKAGAVDQYSIGYDAIVADYETLTGDDGAKRTVRNLREVRLWEYSPVIWGMNPATTTLSAKSATESKPYGAFVVEGQYCVYKLGADGGRVGVSLGCHDTQTEAEAQIAALWAAEGGNMDKSKQRKGATGATNLPLGDRAAAWDGTAAEARVRQWAGGPDNVDFAKYRRAFFWYDAEAPELFGSYKLQFADIVNDELTAMPRGIFAVAAILQGSRGGVDIPSADAEAVQRRVSAYYRRMRSEFDDDGIVPPWEKAGKSINLSERINSVRDAFCAQYNPPEGRWLYWVNTVYDDAVVVEYESETGSTFFRVPYSIGDKGNISFAPRSEWSEGMYEFIPMSKSAIKAGRVLAQRNVDRISAAIRALMEALDEAGVTLGEPEDEPMDEDSKTLTESHSDGKSVVITAGKNVSIAGAVWGENSVTITFGPQAAETPPTSDEAGPEGGDTPDDDARLLQLIELSEAELDGEMPPPAADTSEV